MIPSTSVRAVGLLIAITVGVVSAQNDLCTFTQCDYGKGDRTVIDAANASDCCTKCAARPGCAAGVYADQQCWIKTSAEVRCGG